MPTKPISYKVTITGQETTSSDYSIGKIYTVSITSSWLGGSNDWFYYIYPTVPTDAQAGISSEWLQREGNSHVYLSNFGNGYKIKVHMGTEATFREKKWTSKVKATATFRRNSVASRVASFGNETKNLDVTDRSYKLLGDYSGPASGWSSSWWSVQNFSGSKVFLKFNNSNSDPNSLANGPYLWGSFNDDVSPELTGLSPADGSTIGSTLPVLAGTFVESDSGVDLNSFMLMVLKPDQAVNVVNGDPNLILNQSGFSYQMQGPNLDGSYLYRVKIADNQGNSVEGSAFFRILQDSIAPNISGVTPVPSSSITTLSPVFMANFDDPGTSGVNPMTFQLIIDGNLAVDSTTPGMVVTPANFVYRFPFNLTPGGHTMTVLIGDYHGNITSTTTVFSIPLNAGTTGSPICAYPISNLRQIGAAIEAKYNAIGVNTIAQLAFQDPLNISAITTISLEDAIEHVKLAELAVSDTYLIDSYFSNLVGTFVGTLATMDDATVLAAAPPADPVSTKAQKLDKLRRVLGTLTVVLDVGVLSSTTYGQLITI